jgi:hypothetical protein
MLPSRPSFKANALLVAHDPIFLSRRDQFVALATRHAVPAIFELREFVVASGDQHLRSTA